MGAVSSRAVTLLSLTAMGVGGGGRFPGLSLFILIGVLFTPLATGKASFALRKKWDTYLILVSTGTYSRFTLSQFSQKGSGWLKVWMIYEGLPQFSFRVFYTSQSTERDRTLYANILTQAYLIKEIERYRQKLFMATHLI